MEAVATDIVSLQAMVRFACTLDRKPSKFLADGVLPPLAHWLLFQPTALESELAADGHPVRSDRFAAALPRRMWAGSRIKFHRPIGIGSTVSRRSVISRESEKEARSGRLAIVTWTHLIEDEAGRVCIEEEQDLVYRQAPDPAAQGAIKSGRSDEMASAEMLAKVVPDSRLLFRYSALTFNTHRIHYDPPYAIEGEGYPDLVVQGPLAATLLLYAGIGTSGETVKQFEFRALAPLFVDKIAHLVRLANGPVQELAAFDESEQLAIRAQLQAA
jgi:3-methylfumaryl-CoA hydratase